VTAPDWWPDWRGADCAIVASGPSVKKDDVLMLEDRTRVIAIKENWRLAPFADVVYGCDAAWWRNEVGLPKFMGLKISATRRGLAENYPDIRFVNVLPPVDRLALEQPGVIGSGGNSGFQALNLAVQWGARRILLIGFDMSARSGVHWYGRNAGTGRSNPDEINFRRWRAAFATTPPVLNKLGVVVVNCSPISTLDCFPRASVAHTLKAWADGV
jgi:hypothetical protein